MVKTAPPIGGAVFEPINGGQNKEIIMMTINTFKKFCLTAGTKEDDKQFHNYFKLQKKLHKKLLPQKTKNLYGILGIGLEENNFGIIGHERQTKKIGQFDIKTKNLIREFSGMRVCANELNISYSTFGLYLRSQSVIDGKYYKFIE